jgi:type I restriction enzyme S subunit
MAERDAKATVPEVRFPEFVDAQNWSVAPMRKLYAFMRNNLLSRDKLNYERGVAKNIHYGDIHTKFQALFDITRESVPFINESESVPGADSEDYCVEGDLIFADASEDMRDVGKCIEVIRLAGERLLSGQHTILARPKDDALVIGFGGHLFRSDLMRSRIEKEAQGTKVYQISSSRLGGIDITYPSGKGEQQKIADCLTSLDEVIAAQGRKVEALKAHKRGLMQQLFPREGETRPRLRFPEFRDAPEWIARPLGELMVIGSSRRVHESDWTTTGVPFYRAREIVALAKGEPITPLFISETLYREFSGYTGEIEGGQLLVTGVGSIGIPYLVKSGDRFYFKDGNIIWLKNDQAELTGNFLLRLFESEYVQGQIATMAGIGTVGTYTIDNARRTIVVFPTDKREQQRIADCLASLDTQITAETNQLAALKTHKQGLMQQLFPAPEAATG